jgi:hypothetical protein
MRRSAELGGVLEELRARATVARVLACAAVPEKAAVTSKDGSYEWNLGSGEYDIGVYCEPPRGEAHEIVDFPGGETVVLDVRMRG